MDEYLNGIMHRERPKEEIETGQFVDVDPAVLILAILEDEVYCDRVEGTYDYGNAVARIMAIFSVTNGDQK
jgi:hypothetical protein